MKLIKLIKISLAIFSASTTSFAAISLLSISALTTFSASAEPYLAVRTGLKCASCHVNPTGGGKRNVYGRIYGQTSLPVQASKEPLVELFSGRFDIGGDLRTSFIARQTQNQEDSAEFNTDRANIYFEGKLIPSRLTFYIDQQFAPGSDNRESWLLLNNKRGDAYLKAGKLFQPFGLRLEDDTALIRSIPGINFSTPDNGIELGLEKGAWSSQLTVTNGSAGGAETNTGKQISARVEYIQPKWRLGSSVNVNDGGSQDREMQNVFAGFKWLGSEWLLEADHVKDTNTPRGDINQIATHFEVNREVKKGHNLKLSLEYLDPNTDVEEDDRSRTSLVWEYTPLPLIQVRTGIRSSKGIPQNDQQNTDQLFLQLHGFF